MTDQPAITGLGLITVLGPSVESTWRALIDGERAVTDHLRLDITSIRGRSRASVLAIDVAQQAISQANWTQRNLSDSRTAIVLGTSKGQIEEWIQPTGQTSSHNATVSAAGEFSWGLGQIASQVAASLHLGDGPRITLSAACATGLHALIRGCMMLRHGEADRVLVVGVEASVHPLFIQSFQRLGVLAPPGFGCRPFDESRAGFIMTEAAAAMCLERQPADKSPIVRVERYAIAGDASHLTANEPSGRTLRHVLTQVMNRRSVDFIHAHGTGTVVNDPIELAAIDESVIVDDDKRPIIYSHKGHLGHTLGAAGTVATVLNCVAHERSQVPGNVRTTHPLQATHLTLAQRPIEQRIHRSIVTAAGFGGAIGTVSLVSE